MNIRSKLFFSICISIFTVVTFSTTAYAAVRLPAVFGDDMVLQQQSVVTLWGWASPGEVLMVTTSWNRDTVKTTTTGDADWRLKLKTPVAGGPYQITIKGQNIISLTNVMIGEVWICAGQSNMEWSASRGVKDAQQELRKPRNPTIRVFTVAKATAATEQRDVVGRWSVADSASLYTFSAVGYFFAKKLQEQLNVPVGIINISWGGTPAEVWMPQAAIEQQPDLATHAYSTRFASLEQWPVKSGYAYNAMVAPITAFNIAGVIWYQGESNAGYPSTYHQLFKTLVENWRSVWSKALPFYYVQIAPFSGYGGDDNPALVREQQVRSLAIANTGMVVTTDLVEDVANIHPVYKKGVGDRLANWALAETYHQQTPAYKSPLFQKMVKEKRRIRIYFDHVDQGLVSRGKEVSEFEVAGEDRKFVKALVKIEKNTVLVYSPDIKAPVAVRFAFGKGPKPNLFSTEGLPVSPFRTDKWE